MASFNQSADENKQNGKRKWNESHSDIERNSHDDEDDHSTTEMEQGYQELCKTQPTILVEDFEPMKPLEEEELMEASLTTDRKQVIVGICAMKKKSFSKPMKEILNRLAEFEYLKMIVFEEELLLKPIEEWPICDCLISFHSKGFPLEKAIRYAELRNPLVINHLPTQFALQDRRQVYSILESEGILIPRYAVLDRESQDPNLHELVESEDHVEINGVVFNKPFVEKPVSAEDHNIYIYYPTSAGGGSQRLFRKIGSRSSVYSPESRVRKTGSFIYEDFMPTDGTDVKVYTVGPDYAHAEARKSPALDGKVERDSEDKWVKKVHRLCPYLDTINRQVLDFDFEKLCSVSLSRINVYACLVCGKYFQGRGTNTHAYTHSVAESHHVFLNLQTLKFYCLPDNYEIVDSSLDDIKYVLNPTFAPKHVGQLDTCDKRSRAIDGTLYLPGIVGLNNIKANDYCNVILQALSNVTPLRDYFLDERNYAKVKRPPGDSVFLLVQRFGELMRKLWNPRNFKAHVSPHEMLQAVVLWSGKKFQFTEQGDPIDFLSWFLNSLHRALNGKKSRHSSIVYKTFMGSMRVKTRKIPPVELDEKQRYSLLCTDEYAEHVSESPFLYLTCDLPPPPLFKDEVMENIIPQVSLYSLLTKFNNESEKEYKTYKENFMKRFEITQLPPYLILYIKRFTKNTFFVEKNPTIVNFPVKNVDFGDILTPEVKAAHKNTSYDLIANIVHDGEPNKGTYRVHVLKQGNSKWYEMQDLHVSDILPQMITLTEAYIQIYKLRTDR